MREGEERDSFLCVNKVKCVCDLNADSLMVLWGESGWKTVDLLRVLITRFFWWPWPNTEEACGPEVKWKGLESALISGKMMDCSLWIVCGLLGLTEKKKHKILNLDLLEPNNVVGSSRLTGVLVLAMQACFRQLLCDFSLCPSVSSVFQEGSFVPSPILQL